MGLLTTVLSNSTDVQFPEAVTDTTQRCEMFHECTVETELCEAAAAAAQHSAAQIKPRHPCCH